VVRIHAAPIPAEVIELKPWWDQTYERLVGKPIRILITSIALESATTKGEPGVAIFGDLPGPPPASQRVAHFDLGPKAVGRVAIESWSGVGVAMDVPTGIVLTAHAAGEHRTVAVLHLADAS